MSSIMSSERTVKIAILNTGGTIGMVGRPLRPAATAGELLEGIPVHPCTSLTLTDVDPLKDSTNITFPDRIAMVGWLRENYEEADAFVILHGTDTLDLTLAYFCMACHHTLRKPVFIIGSQMGHEEIGTDAPLQLANTLRVARHFVEDCLYGVYTLSLNRVLEGSRVCKRDTEGFDVFHTPGVSPVATVGVSITMPDTHRRMKPWVDKEFKPRDTLPEPSVATLEVSADTPPACLDALVGAGLRGVILVGKGVGNIPGCWRDALARAAGNKVYVAVRSQVPGAWVDLGRYGLIETDVLGLNDLTPAMAEVKFRIAISRIGEYSPEAMLEFFDSSSTGESPMVMFGS